MHVISPPKYCIPIHVFSNNNVSVAGLSAGAAALSTEERKHNENDPKCNALGWYCVPLVTESYGAWGKEAMDSFKMSCHHIGQTKVGCAV